MRFTTSFGIWIALTLAGAPQQRGAQPAAPPLWHAARSGAERLSVNTGRRGRRNPRIAISEESRDSPEGSGSVMKDRAHEASRQSCRPPPPSGTTTLPLLG